MATLTDQERATIRQRVSAALVNLGAFRLYWLPGHRMTCARSLSVQRAFRVPPGAVEVGAYEAGTIKTRDILDDLAEVIQRTPSHPTP